MSEVEATVQYSCSKEMLLYGNVKFDLPRYTSSFECFWKRLCLDWFASGTATFISECVLLDVWDDDQQQSSSYVMELHVLYIAWSRASPSHGQDIANIGLVFFPLVQVRNGFHCHLYLEQMASVTNVVICLTQLINPSREIALLLLWTLAIL